LKCACQSYAWGRQGSDSSAAIFCQGGNSDFNIDEAKPYAELWMGTHKNGPAQLGIGENQALSEYLKAHPETYGDVAPYEGGGGLPFLYKVLSIRTALSIQSHPDKQLAEQLHAERPEVYKDDNHKPEMAVALTAFEAMCGFRSIEEIAGNLTKYPELAGCISPQARAGIDSTPSSDQAAVKTALQAFLQSFMSCDAELAGNQLQTLLSRLAASGATEAEDAYIEGLVARLAGQYPGDPGAMAPFFLNVLRLEPGDAFFMGANEPHAYLSGEILECMACSDNVVRAGLTPKLKDVPVLVNSLTYRSGAPDVMRPVVQQPAEGVELRRYKPEAVQDFQVDTVRAAPDSQCPLSDSRGPRLLLVMDGDGEAVLGEVKHPLTKGSVLFIAAGNAPQVAAGSSGIFFSVAGTQL